jgi:hypothetical protein
MTMLSADILNNFFDNEVVAAGVPHAKQAIVGLQIAIFVKTLTRIKFKKRMVSK